MKLFEKQYDISTFVICTKPQLNYDVKNKIYGKKYIGKKDKFHKKNFVPAGDQDSCILRSLSPPIQNTDETIVFEGMKSPENKTFKKGNLNLLKNNVKM